MTFVEEINSNQFSAKLAGKLWYMNQIVHPAFIEPPHAPAKDGTITLRALRTLRTVQLDLVTVVSPISNTPVQPWLIDCIACRSNFLFSI